MKLDPTIKLDVRCAGTNNFLGKPVYKEARAFLQRPAVEMPGAYDEMTERSYPDYKGGTTDERARRDLLRTAMESHDFTVEPNEWWHFNYKDWKEYPILDIAFSEIK